MVKRECNKKKPHFFLSTDIYIEDFELLNQIIAEKSLASRKEGLHYWANIVRGVPNSEKKQICQYEWLGFCTNTSEPQRKLRKTTNDYCQACMQAQKNKALQDDAIDIQHAVFDLVGMPYRYRVDPFYRWDFIWDWIVNEKDNILDRLAELEKTPIGEILKEVEVTENKHKERVEKLENDYGLAVLEKERLANEILIMKQQFETAKEEILTAENQKRVALETDNAFLKEELENLKREPIQEKNAWLTVELQQANRKIAELETQIQRQQGETKWTYKQ